MISDFRSCSTGRLSSALALLGAALVLAGCAQPDAGASPSGFDAPAIHTLRGAAGSRSQQGDDVSADAAGAPLSSAPQPHGHRQPHADANADADADAQSSVDDSPIVPACVCGKGSQQTGFASWYGKLFDGRRTASGERYNMHALTAAHRTLPLGACVRVTARGRPRSVVVRINDRGPFVRGRIIDLSYAAAEALGVRAAGHAQVTLEHIAPVRGADGARRCIEQPV
jgi:rare lipoprotein A